MGKERIRSKRGKRWKREERGGEMEKKGKSWRNNGIPSNVKAEERIRGEGYRYGETRRKEEEG